jgi:hypothetical protein
VPGDFYCAVRKIARGFTVVKIRFQEVRLTSVALNCGDNGSPASGIAP